MTTYDATACVRYDDELRSGYVVASTREGLPGRMTTSYWYGPGHGFGTTFGGELDYSVRVWDSRVKAQTAIRKGYGGSYPNRLKVVPLEQARRDRAESLERYALELLDRVRRLRGEERYEVILYPSSIEEPVQ